MGKMLTAIGVVVISLGLILVQPSYGADYPTKPIEIVVTWPAGGTSDLVARLIAEIAKKYLGQPLFVTNKGGAGGTLAVSEVIGAKPDGYKLIYLNNSYYSITSKTQKMDFDPYYLIPITNFTEVRVGLIVKGDSPWKTFGQLVDYAKKNPGKLRWNHAGRGLGNHIVTLLLFRKYGVETIDIPYKGSPAQLAALLGGHVDAASMVYAAVADHVKDGKVRYLVTYGDRRYPVTPDVPTVVELGSTSLITFSGIWARKDTPENIKKILFEAFKKTYEDPEFKKGMERIGEGMRFGGREFVMESIKKDEEVAVPILKELGLYAGGK
jgi:tripartite-type tricarboxylate transporter receptor subunit TctC